MLVGSSRPRPERPRQGKLGFPHQPFLMALGETPEHNGSGDGKDEERKTERSGDSMGLSPENISKCPKQARPNDSARCVEQEKAYRIQAIGAREDRGEGAQHRHETAKEDDLATMP